jgi:hypothetical protein
MENLTEIDKVRNLLQKFQDGYTHRDLEKLDEFIDMFDQSSEVEFIGIGASERGGNEWFLGLEKIREIIESDWEYWGQVDIDVEGAKITINGDAAWLTTTGTLEQTDTFDTALPIYLEQMKKMLEDDAKDPVDKLIEASHFGVRRLRERLKGWGTNGPSSLERYYKKMVTSNDFTRSTGRCRWINELMGF